MPAADRNADQRRSQNMASVKQFQLNIWRNVHLSVVRKTDNLICSFNTVFLIKKRFPCKFFAFFRSLLCKKFRIMSLNARAVHHYKVCNIARCWSCIDISCKSLLVKNWQKSAVVIVTVSKNNSLKVARINVKIAVLFIRYFSVSLEGTAVN